MRGPLAKDHRRKGNEALATDGSLRVLRDDGQRHGRATKACEYAGENHADVARAIDVDAQGLGGLGVLSHRANAKAPLGPVEHEPHDHGGNKAEKHRDVKV